MTNIKFCFSFNLKTCPANVNQKLDPKRSCTPRYLKSLFLTVKSLTLIFIILNLISSVVDLITFFTKPWLGIFDWVINSCNNLI